jgi:hypothetical protein
MTLESCSADEVNQLRQEYEVWKTIDAIVENSKLKELEFAVNAVMDDDFKIYIGETDKIPAHK